MSITLLEKQRTGADEFGAPIYAEIPIPVKNVLVAPASSDDIATSVNLTGRKAVYTLAIPKGDTHKWEGQRLRFFGTVWRVIGLPQTGMDANIPGPWNTKLMVERYE